MTGNSLGEGENLPLKCNDPTCRSRPHQTIDMELEALEKGGYDHFMLKGNF